MASNHAVAIQNTGRNLPSSKAGKEDTFTSVQDRNEETNPQYFPEKRRSVEGMISTYQEIDIFSVSTKSSSIEQRQPSSEMRVIDYAYDELNRSSTSSDLKVAVKLNSQYTLHSREALSSRTSNQYSDNYISSDESDSGDSCDYVNQINMETINAMIKETQIQSADGSETNIETINAMIEEFQRQNNDDSDSSSDDSEDANIINIESISEDKKQSNNESNISSDMRENGNQMNVQTINEIINEASRQGSFDSDCNSDANENDNKINVTSINTTEKQSNDDSDNIGDMKEDCNEHNTETIITNPSPSDDDNDSDTNSDTSIDNSVDVKKSINTIKTMIEQLQNNFSSRPSSSTSVRSKNETIQKVNTMSSKTEKQDIPRIQSQYSDISSDDSSFEGVHVPAATQANLALFIDSLNASKKPFSYLKDEDKTKQEAGNSSTSDSQQESSNLKTPERLFTPTSQQETSPQSPKEMSTGNSFKIGPVQETQKRYPPKKKICYDRNKLQSYIEKAKEIATKRSTKIAEVEYIIIYARRDGIPILPILRSLDTFSKNPAVNNGNPIRGLFINNDPTVSSEGGLLALDDDALDLFLNANNNEPIPVTEKDNNRNKDKEKFLSSGHRTIQKFVSYIYEAISLVEDNNLNQESISDLLERARKELVDDTLIREIVYNPHKHIKYEKEEEVDERHLNNIITANKSEKSENFLSEEKLLWSNNDNNFEREIEDTNIQKSQTSEDSTEVMTKPGIVENVKEYAVYKDQTKTQVEKNLREKDFIETAREELVDDAHEHVTNNQRAEVQNHLNEEKLFSKNSNDFKCKTEDTNIQKDIEMKIESGIVAQKKECTDDEDQSKVQVERCPEERVKESNLGNNEGIADSGMEFMYDNQEDQQDDFFLESEDSSEASPLPFVNDPRPLVSPYTLYETSIKSVTSPGPIISQLADTDAFLLHECNLNTKEKLCSNAIYFKEKIKQLRKSKIITTDGINYMNSSKLPRLNPVRVARKLYLRRMLKDFPNVVPIKHSSLQQWKKSPKERVVGHPSYKGTHRKSLRNATTVTDIVETIDIRSWEERNVNQFFIKNVDLIESADWFGE